MLAIELGWFYAEVGRQPWILRGYMRVSDLRNHNREHFQTMLEVWWLFGLSLFSFFIAIWLVWRRRNYGTAFVMVMLQFAFAFFGYGASHLPYLLYPFLTESLF